MRFLCLTVTLIAVVLSGILGFMTYNSVKYTEKNMPAYEAAQVKTEQCLAEKTKCDSRIAVLTAQREDLKAEIYVLTLQRQYKTTYTAFLSFDDGTSRYTHEILDILNEYGIKATFFVVGAQVKGNGATAERAVQRIVDEGHLLGIHAYEHTYSKLYSSEAAYFEDFDKVTQYLSTLTAYKPYIVRLPSGTATARMFCESYGGSRDIYYDIVSRLYDGGYKVIDWNVDSVDYSSSVDDIISNVLKGAAGRKNATYKNAVILLHDKKNTVEALPALIEGLREMGFAFDTVDKLVVAECVTRQVSSITKP